jgi:hypothetical protein
MTSRRGPGRPDGRVRAGRRSELMFEDARSRTSREAWHPSSVAAGGSDIVAASFGRLAGSWSGSNGFRLMPGDELYEAAARAELIVAAAGYDLVLRYTWVHPADGPQDGVLLVGSPDDEGRVTAAWGDSWHQKPAIAVLNGSLIEGVLEVAADYGGGWRWMISVDGGRDDSLALTMHNVIPDELATDQEPAGPYPVMVSAFQRLA